VALKFVSLNPLDRHDADDDPQEAIEREVQAVRKLNRKNIVRGGEDDQRDLSIVFFEECYRQDGAFACIVMKHADGGTLAQEIERKSKTATASGDELYTERRVAWYALQLAEALAFAHERGVAHHDVKSSNVLIDRKSGGKLLLADFDSAVAPGEESVAFTRSYASPELLHAVARDELAGLQADKIDAYGLGCILYELLSCKKLGDLSKDQTLAEFIQQQGVDAALGLPPLRLPWIQPADTDATQNVIGYSSELKNLVKTLLEPDPSRRWTPSLLQTPLRTDHRCPLLRDTVIAAKKPVPGAAVSVDNVQLGMFVQRGQDWNDEDVDGGIGRIGVVCKLDADAIYTEVAWRCDLQKNNSPSEPPGVCYRIGAGNKFELQVGPTPLADFCCGTDGSRWNGVVEVRDDMSRYRVGQKLNDNCMVVGIHPDQKRLLVIPLALFFDVPTLPQKAPIPEPVDIPRRQPQSPPESWQSDGDLIVEVTDLQEKGDVIEKFYSTNGGMDIQAFEVVSIQRVQSVEMWSRFAREMASVAAENWGLSNQRRLFLGTQSRCPEALVRSTTEISPPALDNLRFRFFAGARFANQQAHRQSATGFRTIVLSRVTLGRLKDNPACNYYPDPLPYHSERHAVDWRSPQTSEQYSIRNMAQAISEYIITYRPIRETTFSQRVRVSPSRGGAPSALPAFSRSQVASGTASSTSGSSAEPKGGSATKQCVVCLSQPVSRILIPCGHPCLCQLCSTQQGLDKLRQKCPECRTPIREAAKIYGRVVND